jgi:hypothetical protein
MRRARRTDGNHKTIAEAFQKLGCGVHLTNADWDLSVTFGGIVMLIEVKNPETAYGKKGKNEKQKTLPVPTYLIRNLDDVEQCVKTLRAWLGFINAGVLRVRG